MANTHIPDLPDFSELSQTAQATDEWYKGINQRLLEFEQKLGALNLNLEVWLERSPLLVERSPSEKEAEANKVFQTETRVYLGWKKAASGKSRLFYKTITKGVVFQRDDLENVERPLLEAPWDIRVEALGRMNDLVFLLDREAKNYLDNLKSKLVSATTK
jgi:hypothetical protein